MLRAIICAVILLLTSVRIGSADAPELFRERSFNAATLALAVNHFVAIGENASLKEIRELIPDPLSDFQRGISERIGWVCRVLFIAKGPERLRPPAFGSPGLPWTVTPLEGWPLFPVALSGHSYFVLSEGYIVAGVPEPTMHYVAYCREKGIFRRKPVKVPTREEAIRDAAALRRSAAWNALRWLESRSADDGAAFIQAQAESIPTEKR